MRQTSLNGGTKHHPLSPHALGVLKKLKRGPLPCSEINPGVQDKLWRDGLVYMGQITSPYKKHKGGTCNGLYLSENGRKHLDSLG